jgi:hypothetical protein
LRRYPGQCGDDSLVFEGVSETDARYAALRAMSNVTVYVTDHRTAGVALFYPLTKSKRPITYTGNTVLSTSATQGVDRSVRFGVALSSQPFAQVTIGVTLAIPFNNRMLTSNETRIVRVEPTSLLFTPSTWSASIPISVVIFDENIARIRSLFDVEVSYFVST